jgi:hypothetical protein
MIHLMHYCPCLNPSTRYCLSAHHASFSHVHCAAATAARSGRVSVNQTARIAPSHVASALAARFVRGGDDDDDDEYDRKDGDDDGDFDRFASAEEQAGFRNPYLSASASAVSSSALDDGRIDDGPPLTASNVPAFRHG